MHSPSFPSAKPPATHAASTFHQAWEREDERGQGPFGASGSGCDAVVCLWARLASLWSVWALHLRGGATTSRFRGGLALSGGSPHPPPHLTPPWLSELGLSSSGSGCSRLIHLRAPFQGLDGGSCRLMASLATYAYAIIRLARLHALSHTRVWHTHTHSRTLNRT